MINLRVTCLTLNEGVKMKEYFAMFVIFLLVGGVGYYYYVNYYHPTLTIESKSVVEQQPVVKTVKTAPKVEIKESEVLPEATLEDEEKKANALAENYVKQMAGYANQNGREITIISSAKSGCEGCWIVELTFTRDLLYYPDKTEHIKMNIQIRKWKVESYTFN
jgi:hypothetical protein